MKTTVPKLRFKEFNGSWDISKVGEFCDFIVPGRNKPKHFGGDIPWITTPDILHNGLILFSKSGLMISKDEAKKVGSKIVPINSVVISCVGDLGLVALAGTEIIINQQLHAFIPKTIHHKFLLYELSCKKKYMERVATKTAVPYLNKDNCNSIPINFPSLPEQQKIASFLSAVDEKIQQLMRKKELLEQFKKGVMQQLFSGKLRFKDENGKPYPKWERKRLNEVSEINPSTGQLPESFIYIDLESVLKGQLILERRIERNDAPSRAQRFLQPNDILYQTVRPYQMNNLLFNKVGDYVASTGYAQIRTNEDTEYIFQLLHTTDFVNEVIERCTGTSFPAVNSKDLGKIKVSIPHKEEQKKIATYLSALDTKIQDVGRQITQTQTFKKGLLQQMFV